MQTRFRFAWACFIAAILAAPVLAISATEYDGTAKTAAGVAINAATCTVYVSATSATKATIYSDGSGSSQANPFTTASNGTYTIFLASGRYRIDCSNGTTVFSNFVTMPTQTTGGGPALPVSVANGGTGATSLTSHGVVIGQGTSAVHVTAAGTSGLPLVSGGASADGAYGTIGSAAIADGSLVNADVNASAAIALSKLATATASKCARFDSGGVLVPASGDCPSGDTGISGLGSTDNAVLRADGAGGATAQGSAVTINDSGVAFFNGFGAGVSATSDSRFTIWTAGHESIKTDGNNSLIIRKFAHYCWTDAPDINGTTDTCLDRADPAVLRPQDASGNPGWIGEDAGNAALANNYTNSTATLTSLTGLTINLKAGRKYLFRTVLFCSNSVAAEGMKLDFNGGSATATDFRAHVKIFDTALLLSSQLTALSGAASVATMTGASEVEIDGEFVVNAAGTFIVEAAENAHTTGTLTCTKGSHILVTDSLFF